jgi:hypothetical protein
MEIIPMTQTSPDYDLIMRGGAIDSLRRLCCDFFTFKTQEESEVFFAFLNALSGGYKINLEMGYFVTNQYTTLKFIKALRVYVAVLRVLGRTKEAEAWEKEFNETEGIILGLQQAALEELREEMAQEKSEATTHQEQGPKNLTRTQKRRLAAKRKKEREEQQQQLGQMAGVTAAAAPVPAAAGAMVAAAAYGGRGRGGFKNGRSGASRGRSAREG